MPLAVVLAATLAGGAAAHAFLDHASPRVGSVGPAPARLQLWFTQGVVAPFCQVSVTGPRGFGGAVAPAPIGAQSLVVTFKPPVPAGAYTVRWRVLSVDTHITTGDFSFVVRP